jgi:hypothetical protein
MRNKRQMKEETENLRKAIQEVDMGNLILGVVWEGLRVNRSVQKG